MKKILLFMLMALALCACSKTVMQSDDRAKPVSVLATTEVRRNQGKIDIGLNAKLVNHGDSQVLVAMKAAVPAHLLEIGVNGAWRTWNESLKAPEGQVPADYFSINLPPRSGQQINVRARGVNPDASDFVTFSFLDQMGNPVENEYKVNLGSILND